ncbi:hypothetical protein BDZ91DRAFT_545542 [Kalaharituber pfeilii]|nr:hypothetical protein BDZ91DRAFT_545542 [Kalaharituber pfeilii]
MAGIGHLNYDHVLHYCILVVNLASYVPSLYIPILFSPVPIPPSYIAQYYQIYIKQIKNIELFFSTVIPTVIKARRKILGRKKQ